MPPNLGSGSGGPEPPEKLEGIAGIEEAITDRNLRRPVPIERGPLLTGFCAPVEGVMYLDKPLKAHTFFQAVCRTAGSPFSVVMTAVVSSRATTMAITPRPAGWHRGRRR